MREYPLLAGRKSALPRHDFESTSAEGVCAIPKTLKFMVNVLLVGIAIGRTYAAWQQRTLSRRRSRAG
jgi:hypothetical protein